MPTPTPTLLVVASLTLAGCLTQTRVPDRPVARESISIVSPRCVGARSCVLGHVTTVLDAAPIAKAAVFLTREGRTSGQSKL